MKILVVGGAGYIGSHMSKDLVRAGFEVVVLDNLVSGHADAVKYGELIVGDVADQKLLRSVFSNNHYAAVMHFASHIQVGESVRDPAKYYSNNLVATLGLLDAMRAARVNNFIFSSSAAVYGEPESTPIAESHVLAPMNPYGQSKFMAEQVLADYAEAYELHYASLRYFNAAGADPECELGERHDPETHLIPLVMQAACGDRADVTVFGSDYATRDGTCERDYVHVSDLAEAHRLALRYLLDGGASGAFNLGSGRGYTVHEIIEGTRRITSRDIRVLLQARRSGDPARLIADPRKAMQILRWQPRYSDLQSILTHTWQWQQKIRPSS